jgi:hypothetical protein
VIRLLYAQRDEPFVVVTRLSPHVESSLTHEKILPTIVETITQALNQPYAAIALRASDERVIGVEPPPIPGAADGTHTARTSARRSRRHVEAPRRRCCGW